MVIVIQKCKNIFYENVSIKIAQKDVWSHFIHIHSSLNVTVFAERKIFPIRFLNFNKNRNNKGDLKNNRTCFRIYA